MKIEEGKYYKTRDGRKVGPMKRGHDGSVSAFWVCDGYPLEGEASEWFEDGSFWPDGHYNHSDRTAARDLIAEWTEEQIGTLAELDVKPGDVVTWHAPKSDHYNRYDKFAGIEMTVRDHLGVSFVNPNGRNGGFSYACSHKFRMIYRAKPAPSIDLTAITTPFGLLDKATQDALIAHGGPYQCYRYGGWNGADRCDGLADLAIRVKPKPALVPDTVPWDAIAPEYVQYVRTASGACYICPRAMGWRVRVDGFLVGHSIGSMPAADATQYRPGYKP